MEINFDKLQDEILDIKDERFNENRAIASKISQWLNQQEGKCFDFSEIKEATKRNIKPIISYFNREDGMDWMERYQMSVDYIQYYPESQDFEAVGSIEGEGDAFAMMGIDLDLESLNQLVGWLAQYQREQNGTARTPEQIEHERLEEDFGKEYFTNEHYRLYIETQLEPDERLMLAVYNNAPENHRKNIPLPKRTRFALVLRDC